MLCCLSIMFKCYVVILWWSFAQWFIFNKRQVLTYLSETSAFVKNIISSSPLVSNS